MATYIYCPVMTGEMIAVANTWNNGRVARGKAPYQVIGASDSGAGKMLRRAFLGGKLDQVQDNDKLYVLAHGYQSKEAHGALVIGAQRGDYVASGRSLTGYAVQAAPGVGPKLYRAVTFAKHLEDEGLSKGFIDLRLFCCGSGLDGKQNGVNYAPYASRLKAAMVARGYTQIMVAGYLGDLGADHMPRFAPGTSYADPANAIKTGKGVTLPGDTYGSPASQHRVRF
jgi:hypothetical protein